MSKEYIECPNAWDCGEKCQACEDCRAQSTEIIENCDGCCGVAYCRLYETMESWSRNREKERKNVADNR